jgi:hypothetical protein
VQFYECELKLELNHTDFADGVRPPFTEFELRLRLFNGTIDNDDTNNNGVKQQREQLHEASLTLAQPVLRLPRALPVAVQVGKMRVCSCSVTRVLTRQRYASLDKPFAFKARLVEE